MAVSLSVADVIDKNKIASENAWLILVDVEIRDELDQVVDTLSLVSNNENIEYREVTYLASKFDLSVAKRANEEPSIKFSATDVTGAIRDKMEEYGGGVGSSVTVTVVNHGNLDADPELVETFDVLAASAPDINVEWTLGAENPLKYQFPYRRQYRDRCPWVFKGKRCGYTGSMTSCDFTKNGVNGCRAHDNVRRFGGFPGLQNKG